MANRTYTNRFDFVEGWQNTVHRYAKPGTIKNLFNCLLDPYNKEAVRQVYGARPVMFTKEWHGTSDLFRRAYPTWIANDMGKFPGVALIEPIKFGGDDGDTVLSAVNYAVGSTATTEFFYNSEPNTATRVFGGTPFTTPIPITVPHDADYKVFGRNFVSIRGYNQLSTAAYEWTVTATVAPTFGALAYGANDDSTYTAPASGTTDSFTLEWTDDNNGDTAAVAFDVTLVAAGTVVANDHYAIIPAAGHPHRYGEYFYSERDQYQGDDYSPFFSWSNNNYNGTTWSVTGGVGGSTWTLNADGPATLSFISGLMAQTTASPYATFSYGDGVNTASARLTVATYRESMLDPDNADSYIKWSTPMESIYTITGTHSMTGPIGIWRVAAMNGQAYVFNGAQTPFKVDISTPATTGTIGLTRPDATGLAFTATTTTVEVKGIVRYAVATIDGDFQEGPTSDWEPGRGSTYAHTATEEGFDALDGREVTIDNIPLHATSGRARLYRTMSDRAQPYFLADLLGSPGGTMSYVDTTNDLDLGDLPWVHGDVPPADAFSPIAYYDRLWVLGTRPGVAGARRTTLFWSDINEPESFWHDGNWANVYADDGDEVTALVRDRSGLLIYKHNHIYRMAGRIPEDLAFVEVTSSDSASSVGTPSPASVVSTDYGVFFYWRRGIYRYGEGAMNKISDPISTLLEIGSDTWSLPVEDSQVTVHFDSLTKFLYVSVPKSVTLSSAASGEGQTGDTYIYDVETGRWIGHQAGRIQFGRRVNVKMYNGWGAAAVTGAQVKSAYLFNKGGIERTTALDFYSCGHVLMQDEKLVGTAGSVNKSWLQLHPVVGNLGPFASKRFIYVDYLLDPNDPGFADGVGGVVAASGTLRSDLFLDGTNESMQADIVADTGLIYTDRLRHKLGNVAAEIEPILYLDHTDNGEIFNLFEYSVTFMNLGKQGTGGHGSSLKGTT